ncbi:hypothetical protein Tco_1304603 [Tanacetum coccineum]
MAIHSIRSKLDLELVPKEKRLEIGKCNGRLNPRKIQREPTFQVVLDALALTPCYSAFLITADVPKVYMHQFWDFVYKHDTFYRFKMDKRKRFKLTLEIFRDIFKICPRVQGQDFDALPTDEEIVSFLRELGHTREINSLNDVIVDQMHQPWRTFAALINKSLSGKTTGLDKLRLSRAQILWESTQIYGKLLPESLTSPEIKESKAYKTYHGFATGDVPLKIARKFKKASPSKKDINLNLVLVEEEPKSDLKMLYVDALIVIGLFISSGDHRLQMECFNNMINLDEEHTNSPTITNSKLEIGDEFLKILQDNAFNGMDGGDVTDDIAKVIEITEWIKIPNVEINELRILVFSKSLTGDAQKWLNNEVNETTVTWKELTNKFFHKYYPLSVTCNSKIPDDLDNGTDYFEFIYWLASKFDNYLEIDRNTKNGLWEYYVNERTNGRIGNFDECNEKCSDTFYKPYLDAQDANDVYKAIDREYSSIPITATLISTTRKNSAKLKNSQSFDTR